MRLDGASSWQFGIVVGWALSASGTVFMHHAATGGTQTRRIVPFATHNTPPPPSATHLGERPVMMSALERGVMEKCSEGGFVNFVV